MVGKDIIRQGRVSMLMPMVKRFVDKAFRKDFF
jgi:hypothetical protein